MPGSVANAAASTVLPQGLCRAFAASREWLYEENQYRAGESQRRARVATSRKSWEQSRPVTAAQWAALLAFLEARRWGLEPFYFYDPFEPGSGQPVGSNYDGTGVSAQGRYTVVLRGAVQGEIGIPRGGIGLSLVEVA